MDLWENPLTALYVSCNLYNPKQSCFPAFLNQLKTNGIGFHIRTVPFMMIQKVRFLIKILSSSPFPATFKEQPWQKTQGITAKFQQTQRQLPYLH